MFTHRYVTSVIGYYRVVFTLYTYIVLEKIEVHRQSLNKLIFQQRRKVFRATTIAMEIR